MRAISKHEDSSQRTFFGKDAKGLDTSPISPASANSFTYSTWPQTGLAAKFSEQFAIAAAVILGHMDVDDLVDTVVQRVDIQVKLNPIDEYDLRDPVYSPTESVVIRLTNGEVLDSGPIAKIRGHAYDPLSRKELWDKFRSCTARTHTEADGKQLFELLQSIDTLRSAHDLPTCNSIFTDRAGLHK